MSSYAKIDVARFAEHLARGETIERAAIKAGFSGADGKYLFRQVCEEIGHERCQ